MAKRNPFDTPPPQKRSANTSDPVIRLDADPINADWTKQERDVDTDGKPIPSKIPIPEKTR